MDADVLEKINTALAKKLETEGMDDNQRTRYVALGDMVDYWLDGPVITDDLKAFISAAHTERKRIGARLPAVWR